MLSGLDDVIYPNRCEVIEIEPSQRYIYPIYKNGYTSININSTEQKHRRYYNEQITKLTNIDIIVRNPTERFVSGVNTFVWNLMRDYPKLDKETILHFVKHYLFLNRHYSPQLSWIINLARYLAPDAKLKIAGMESIGDYTSLHVKPEAMWILDDETVQELRQLTINQMYIRLDKRLFDLIGKSWTVRQIIVHLMNRDPQAFFDTIGKNQALLGVSHVLP